MGFLSRSRRPGGLAQFLLSNQSKHTDVPLNTQRKDVGVMQYDIDQVVDRSKNLSS